MSDLVLYNYFRSSTSYRVRIALNLKGLSYTYKPVHLLNNGGEQHSPEYRKINPLGGVPSLVHQGKIISQSRAIIEYLDQINPEPALLPKDAYQRAEMNQLCDNINCEIHPLSNLRVMQMLEKKFLATSEQKEEWIRHWNNEGLSASEKILQKTAGIFCIGDQITMADLFLIPHLFSAKRLQVDLSPYPIMQKINENCLKLNAFQVAHPHRQVDTPADLKA